MNTHVAPSQQQAAPVHEPQQRIREPQQHIHEPQQHALPEEQETEGLECGSLSLAPADALQRRQIQNAANESAPVQRMKTIQRMASGSTHVQTSLQLKEAAQQFTGGPRQLKRPGDASLPAIQRKQEDGTAIQRKEGEGGHGSQQPIQRVLKIEGDKYNTLAKFKESDDYEKVWTWLQEKQPKGLSKKAYDKTLNQYTGNDTVEPFLSMDQFKNNVLYDIQKGIWTKDANADATVRYMTRRGWKNAADNKGTIDDGHAKQSISLYRTMTLKEAKEIMIDGDISKLKGHMGDYAAALGYLYKANDDRVLVEFKMKPGAHKTLFSTSKTAISPGGTTADHIRTRHETEDAAFAKASQNEGTHDEKLGIKSETHGTAGFSFAAHGDVAEKEFKPLVESIVPLMIGKAGSKSPTPITKSEFRKAYTD